MEIKIPSKLGFRYNYEADYLQPNTPVKWSNQINSHYFLGLIRDCGPFILQVVNEGIVQTIEVVEYVQGYWEIIPLRHTDQGNESTPLAIKTQLFDVDHIPYGSIFIDQDGMSFIITAVDPFYLTIIDHNSETADIRADVFFADLFPEREDCRLILPPLYAQELMKEADAYKAANETESDKKYGE